MVTRTRLLVIAAVVLAAAAPPRALGWGLFHAPSAYSSSGYYSAYPACGVPVVYARPAYVYVSMPVYAAPLVVAPPTVAVGPLLPGGVPVVQPVPRYAQPTPAPPSQIQKPQSTEPPTTPTRPAGPKVTESKALYNTYTGDRSAGTSTRSGPIRVGFWNTRSGEVALSVNGQSYSLAGGRALTLSLPREFAWRMDEGTLHAESVPADRASFEIVIR